AWKLAAVLRGHADETLLESYNDERLEAAQENVKVTRRTARFLRPADGLFKKVPPKYNYLIILNKKNNLFLWWVL
ncbi:MAG: FAD-dependent monooxygenase, partial [Microcystis aeruginosa]